MKLSSIKTQEQFDEFADNWYQRTINLERASNKRGAKAKYKFKAFLLYLEMMDRMHVIKKIYLKQAIVKNDFPSGSITVVGNSDKEEIILKPKNNQ